MLEKPDLSDELLIRALAQGYAIHVTALTFLPIGNDATCWVYRADAGDGRAYFLKIKRGPLYKPSLTVPRFLVEQGIDAVVAPLPARGHTLWIPVSEFILILYPFIEGPTGMEAGLSAQQWASLGAILRRVHAQQPRMARIRRESFRPQWAEQVQAIQQCIDGNDFSDSVAAEFAACWHAHQDDIQRICARADQLGRLSAASELPFVLCHSDIHTANILVDAQGKLHLVDWDQPILAPKERDLMFFLDSGPPAAISDPSLQQFLDGYGDLIINRVALAYYRYEWVVQEFGDNGRRVLNGDGGDIIRAEALRSFRQLFNPGDVVDAAGRAEGWM